MSLRGTPELNDTVRVVRPSKPIATPSVGGEAREIGESGDGSANGHQCRYCNSWYARPDHLKRHMRSHDNARLYRCGQCSRGFNRKDLLDRHQIVHERSPTAMGPARTRRHRTAKACEQCAAAKTKCWGGLPCNRCQRRGDACLFGFDQSVPGPFWIPSQDQDTEPQSLQADSVPEPGQGDMLQLSDRIHVSTPKARSESPASQHPDMFPADDHTTPSLPMEQWTDLGEESHCLFNDTMTVHDDLELWSDINFFSAQSMQAFPDFETMLEAARPPGNDVAGWESALLEQSVTKDLLPPRHRSLSNHEAFQRSPWLWSPKRSDSGSLEESPRLTDSEAEILSSSAVAVEVERFPQCASKRCGSNVREALLLLVQLHTESAINVASFPSAMSLDMLLQRFLYRQMTSTCPFIHVPSFDPEGCRTELLAAMIASIASSSANRVISKMGLALQEKIRIALAKAFYHDDRLVRSLEMMQTAILWIETGLWSGARRKMEVAESAANNVPTMIRRGGALPRSCYQDELSVSEDDEGLTLRRHWLKWVETETYKRTAFRAFMGDVQSSIAYLRSPCFYSTDIDFELPAAQDLWDARTPTEWKAILLSKPPRTNGDFLSLLDVAVDPMLLASAGEAYDLKLSALVALHCMWIQVASFLDSRALFRGEHSRRRRGSSLLWLEAQRQDLYLKLKQTQCILNQLLLSSAETRMICEFLSMSLYASPAEIQKAAGRFGEEESRSTLPNLQSWIQSEKHRYSIWHAGQVLRSAECMSGNCIYGFFAIPVYQACLTLLTAVMAKATIPPSADRRGYGHSEVAVTQLATQIEDRSSTALSLPVIVLNGKENEESEGYLITGYGMPALQVNGEVELLSKPGTIPSIMESIFRENHGNANALPPLLGELLALIKDLSTTAWGS